MNLGSNDFPSRMEGRSCRDKIKTWIRVNGEASAYKKTTLPVWHLHVRKDSLVLIHWSEDHVLGVSGLGHSALRIISLFFSKISHENLCQNIDDRDRGACAFLGEAFASGGIDIDTGDVISRCRCSGCHWISLDVSGQVGVALHLVDFTMFSKFEWCFLCLLLGSLICSGVLSPHVMRLWCLPLHSTALLNHLEPFRMPGSAVLGSTALLFKAVAPGPQSSWIFMFCSCKEYQTKHLVQDAAGKFSMPKGPNSEREERRGWSAPLALYANWKDTHEQTGVPNIMELVGVHLFLCEKSGYLGHIARNSLALALHKLWRYALTSENLHRKPAEELGNLLGQESRPSAVSTLHNIAKRFLLRRCSHRPLGRMPKRRTPPRPNPSWVCDLVRATCAYVAELGIGCFDMFVKVDFTRIAYAKAADRGQKDDRFFRQQRDGSDNPTCIETNGDTDARISTSSRHRTYILIFRIFLPSFLQPYEIDGQADTKPPRRSDTATYRHTDAHAWQNGQTGTSTGTSTPNRYHR